MSSYTFSIYVKINITRLKPRPWWKLFGRDSLDSKPEWKRLCISGLTKAEAEALMAADWTQLGWPSLFLKALGGPCERMQLEQGAAASEYVTFAGPSLEKSK